METIKEELDPQIELSLDVICSATGRPLTHEQKLFASDFTKPTISFSDAGTGKTEAAAVGIVNAQVHHGVKGSKLCVLSFTRESAREISQRYNLMTKFKTPDEPARFSTFHSLCYSVLQEAWGKVDIQKGNDYVKDIESLRDVCTNNGLNDVTDMWLRKLLNTINSMNACFVFDEEYLKEHYKFKELRIAPDVFNNIRVDWFVGQVISKSIPQGDIPIHCYYALKRKEAVRKKFNGMFDVLIADEFQDMTILYLKILFELTKSMVVIGDMKQQIYGFNGASDVIVQEFLDMYPNAVHRPLTHSWRCLNNVIDTAMKFELPNRPPILKYSGAAEGGEVIVAKSRDFNLEDVISDLKYRQDNRETVEHKDVMFLSSNNLSVLSVIERLYQAGVNFRTTKFKRVMDIPIFREMSIIIDAILDDKNTRLVSHALRLFKEFRYIDYSKKLPIEYAMESSGKGWLDIDYRYKETYMHQIIKLLKRIREAIEEGVECSRIFATLLPIYEDYILEGNWWRLEFEKSFYLSLVGPVVKDKTYERMVYEENEKEAANKQNNTIFEGVRCYTVHSAKGLEADEVYVLDCEEAIWPSKKNITKLTDNKSYYEAARMLRNQRNLLYVATTRARSKVVLMYESDLSELIKSPDSNSYSYLDDIYFSNKKEFDNEGAFMKIFCFDE